MELPVHVHVCLGSTEFYFFFKHTQITKIVSQVQINQLNDSDIFYATVRRMDSFNQTE